MPRTSRFPPDATDVHYTAHADPQGGQVALAVAFRSTRQAMDAYLETNGLQPDALDHLDEGPFIIGDVTDVPAVPVPGPRLAVPALSKADQTLRSVILAPDESARARRHRRGPAGHGRRTDRRGHRCRATHSFSLTGVRPRPARLGCPDHSKRRTRRPVCPPYGGPRSPFRDPPRRTRRLRGRTPAPAGSDAGDLRDVRVRAAARAAADGPAFPSRSAPAAPTRSDARPRGRL